jgi:flagellar biosynthetic protein FliO
MLIGLLFLPAFGQSASPVPASPGPQESVAAAAPAEQEPIAMPAEVPGEGLQFPVLRTIGGLGVVVFLMIAVFFGAKKFAPRYFNKPSSEKNLKVIETLSMGDRRSISLIEVANSRFLVGNTPHQINLLSALPEPFSLVSEPETLGVNAKSANIKETRIPFRNLFEVEKNRPSQNSVNSLPEDLRTKMRQLRDALERS